VRGKRVLIVAGTGPSGIRGRGLFAKAGADVCITSRKADAGERARELVLKRFGGTVRAIAMPDAKEAIRACEARGAAAQRRARGGDARAEASVGQPAGAQSGRGRECGSPLGIEGVEVMDDGVAKEGVVSFGALAIGTSR